MLRTILALFFATSFTLLLHSQKPKKLNATQIYESIQKLNFLGSVLYVAAHPDDENTRLISYFSNEIKARTAYLSLTRGDGGQNLIGPELRELLGVLRTQELLAARSIDGGSQIFTRANDFGYSKHPDETLEIWDKESVLSDVVWAIRSFKPDVIINRFDHESAGKTHGHHTSSALLSMEAFDLVSDKTKFSDQLKYVETWQPTRLFFNTSWWFYGSQENFNKADKSDMLKMDIGVYYPLKGLSNNEVASLASSQHLCQGFGRLTQRGSQEEYIKFLKGDFPEDQNNLFSGIDTSWHRIEGGREIGKILKDVETNFNFENPSSHVHDLMRAYQLITTLKNTHWKIIKTEEIKTIIEACTGLYLEASSNTPTVSNSGEISLKLEVLNRSDISCYLVSYNMSTIEESIQKNIKLLSNNKFNFEESLNLTNANYTTPYWLNKKGTLGMYEVDDRVLIGQPETPRDIHVTFNLRINNMPISFKKDVVYRYSKPDKGELYRPLEIIPEVSASITEKVIIFDNDQQQNIQVKVRAGKDGVDGHIQLAYPEGWTTYPNKQRIKLNNKDEEQLLTFTIIPPKNQSEGYITPIVSVGDNIYTKELVEISYEHIPFQTVLLPSQSKVVRINLEKRGENIAYIEGAGDVVPESLQQIGYQVVKLKPEDISAKSLSRFDAVVLGIRAYNVLDELKFKQQLLFDYVEKGGNMIVQYNTNRGIKVAQLAPYPLKLSRDRVTDENSEVRIIQPNHELLNFPNKITQEDFKGWTQERGLYFPGEWSENFMSLLALNDKGEAPKTGSLLVAKHGKGYYIYTGLSFFREFPAGVPGAFRLFANMLSIGKNHESLKKN
ncbi:MAG: PIG-L family deacetylase [Flavobacteriaceae bacterium]|nr:PIG-L family deacetylase [Flavobacteriaceae bacterium]MDG2350675.1 PIG-L family deacetylase [Flavobacteriaceae bacterium]